MDFSAASSLAAPSSTYAAGCRRQSFGTVSWELQPSAAQHQRTDQFGLLLILGFVALLWTRFLYPGLSNLIERIPHRVGIVLTWTLFAFLVYDILVSAAAGGPHECSPCGKTSCQQS
ncbi:MAG: putative ABC transporter permease [Clostridia bacterium]